MRSKANIKSHPLHPILVTFPIAFFTGTLAFDIVALVINKPGVGTIAYYLEIAGIITALIAAIPGLIDLIYTIPPRSSGKKRGWQHAFINITVVIIFLVTWLLRRNQPLSSTIIISMEAIGVILLSISGWLGGTLVYRNQIGVDHRYANAGKWKEKHIENRTGLIEVAAIAELELNQMKLIHKGQKRIALARTENGYVAFDDHCTHRGGSLADGVMICGTVQCPWHGSQFDASTGEVKSGPAKEKIATYRVIEKEGRVFIEFPA